MESAIRKVFGHIKSHKRSIFIIFEGLCLLFLWVVSPFLPSEIALVTAVVAAFLVSLMFVPLISKVYSFLKEKNLFDVIAFGIVSYGTGYLFTLYLAIEILQKAVEIFNISEVKIIELNLQIIPFILYIILFCLFRDPKQQQYWAYALVYGGSLIWEWINNWELTSSLFLEINTDFILKFFIEPFKEAMLLFIILDTFFKAKDELKQEKRLCNGEKKIC